MDARLLAKMSTVPFNSGRKYPLPSDIAKKLPHNPDAERAVLGAVLLNTLAEAFGLPERAEVPLLPGEEVRAERTSAGVLAALFRGEVAAVCVESGRKGSMCCGPTHRCGCCKCRLW